MATLRDIRRRIASVKSTQQITRAMKLVAASKLRRAQERIVEARPYCRAMDAMVSNLVCGPLRELHPLLREGRGDGEPATKRRLLLVISSDRGLCGAFNSNIIRRSMDLLRAEQGKQDVSLALIVVGRKVRDFYKRHGEATVRSEHVNFFDKLAYRHAAQIGQEVATAFAGGEVDEVELVYTEFRSATGNRPVVRRILPVMPAPKTSATERLFEPGPAEILDRLMPLYVRTAVRQAFTEAETSEHAARMVTMEQASVSACRMISELTLVANRLRQSTITRELADIVGTTEALAL